ncbi:succinic semialdehyde dehydrogenase [Microlunatus panaciterrae]|uniref:Succinate-semialdehyde dehydrogenase/glutarate-semialdehyde dehydrogenase n=1 Tax=Microlunatus panaciterrae TaxID=400768 RepID=A0ABS2RLN5_9ACTN|nr:succinic semialdehyde dehydrogenase [Microlunatus panaciterrae]MBM7799643.1 succinate-semialdehyde dehydrogenase/glutarate-semialdehyde dehydrogenase [Microlunatus panaciterrae]
MTHSRVSMALPPAGPADLTQLADRVAASGPRVELCSPYDHEVLATIRTSTREDVRTAAAAARQVQPGWAGRPVEQRARVLLDFHDRLMDRRDHFVDLVQRESGKSRLAAVEEVLHVAVTARYYGRTAQRHLRSERGLGLFPVLTRLDRNYLPKGLVGVIGPWNYPFTMMVSDALAAVVAGNAILAKPDAQTPLVSLAAVELLEECGLPSGLWQVVNGDGGQIGPALIDQVDYVCFTGSTATGTKIAEQCAQRLIGCSLELGGKNPLLVLADADVDKAAEGAVRSCFSNAGQLCVSAERIYVSEPLMAEFCAAFVARTRALKLGRSMGFDSEMGCLIDAAHLQRVERHVDDARRKGATVLTGGQRRPDLGELFFEPTVLTGVTPEMDCYADETFGPVVSIYPVADDEEAVARANDSAYGLNASVWTSDPERGRRVAARIRCGSVNVNEGFAATFGSIDAPMGGMKGSGLGRRQGIEGIRRFVEVQSVATQSGVPIAPSHGMDAGTFTAVMTGVLRVLRRIGRP